MYVKPEKRLSYQKPIIVKLKCLAQNNSRQSKRMWMDFLQTGYNVQKRLIFMP